MYRRRVRIALHWAKDNLWVKKVLAPSKNPSKSPTICFARIKNNFPHAIRITGTLMKIVAKVCQCMSNVNHDQLSIVYI
jgi:hypothetical protein